MVSLPLTTQLPVSFVVGAHPIDTLSATMMLATTLIATQGDLVRAAELEAQVIGERTRILGAQHPDTLRSRANHLLTQHDLGQQAASAERRAVIAELASVLGNQHPNISILMNGRRLLSVIDPQPF